MGRGHYTPTKKNLGKKSWSDSISKNPPNITAGTIGKCVLQWGGKSMGTLGNKPESKPPGNHAGEKGGGGEEKHCFIGKTEKNP